MSSPTDAATKYVAGSYSTNSLPRLNIWASNTDPWQSTMVYDANVLHPASLRDFLIRLACTRLYRARWTDAVLNEMVTSVIRANPELDPDRIARTRHLDRRADKPMAIQGKYIPK